MFPFALITIAGEGQNCAEKIRGLTDSDIFAKYGSARKSGPVHYFLLFWTVGKTRSSMEGALREGRGGSSSASLESQRGTG